MIAVIGVGCRFPDADDAYAFWENIARGKVSFGPVPKDRWNHQAFFSESQRDVDKTWTDRGAFIADVRSFAALHYGLSPRRLEVMDPQHRLLIEVTRDALLDAGYETRNFDRSRVGVYAGLSASEYKNLMMGRIFAMGLASGTFGPAAATQELRDAVLAMAENTAPTRAFSIAGGLHNMGPASVSSVFDFGGPSFALDAACSAASVAIFDAIAQLRANLVDLAVAGGAYLNLTPENLVAFTRVGAISPTGACRPFDHRADGFVQGDGVGMLLLKRLADAKRDKDPIRAVIRGVGCNNDGRGEGPMTPRVEGQLAALRAAYRDANCSASSIAYFEAHGTGTAVGDPVEVEALGRLLEEAGVDRNTAPLCGSVKANIGHAMSAAGIAGVIKAIGMLEHKIAPPHPGFEAPHPAMKLDRWPLVISTKSAPLEPRGSNPLRVGVSSFGFGGTNVHFVLEEAPTKGRAKRTAPNSPEEPEALIVSAPTLALLAKHLGEIASALKSPRAASAELADLAYTLNACRKHQRVRAVFAARSKAEWLVQLEDLEHALLARKLEALPSPRAALLFKQTPKVSVFCAPEPGTEPFGLAFLFPGQGAQRVGMLAAARRRFPAFANALAELDHAVEGVLPRPLSSYVYPELRSEEERQAAEVELQKTEICQPAMAAVGLSLSRFLRSLGIAPAVSLGHSLGEFSAVSDGGLAAPGDIVRLVAERGIEMNQLRLSDAGAMAAVSATAERVELLIRDIDGVVLANYNHPEQVSIAGPTSAVDQALETLERAGISCTRLSVSHAFHSPLLAELRPAMAKLLERLPLSTSTHTVASCIAAHPYSTDPEKTKAVLLDHATAPVTFTRGLQQAKDAGARVFVQIGAGSTLAGFARATFKDPDFYTVTLSPFEDDGALDLLKGIATLSALGTAVDFFALYQNPDQERRPVDLPATPLLREAYWVIKNEPQPLPRLRHPLPAPKDGFLAAHVSTSRSIMHDPQDLDANPNPSRAHSLELIELFRKQAEILGSHAEIIAAQNRLLLGETAPNAKTDANATTSVDLQATARPSTATATPPTATAKTSEAAPEPSATAIADGVFSIVAKVSAFPRASIRPEQRLTDELGFDSIMVADLVKSLEATHPGLGALPQTMFSTKTTVGDLTRFVAQKLSSRGSEAPHSATADEDEEAPLSSYRIEVRPTVASPLPLRSLNQERWLVVGDSSVLAAELCSALSSAGVHLLRLELVDKDIPPPEKLIWGAHTAWPARALLGVTPALQRTGQKPDGLIFLAGTQGTLLGLHALVQTLRVPHLVAVTNLGGKLGLHSSPALAQNGSQAALIGYLKALARERPEDHIAALDLDPTWDARRSAQAIVRELASADADLEIGLSEEGRFAPFLLEDKDSSNHRAPVGPSDVVLITGGGGELGKKVAKQLSKAGPKGIALLGRRHPDDTLRTFIDQLNAGGTKALYLPVDITDERALRQASEEISRSLGTPTVALHAAATIADAPVEKKTPAAIQRVMNVKVLGLGALMRAFPGLSSVVIFSSWAGRFGNASQTDYAAANELVDRVAVTGAGTTRVLAIDWPPWTTTAMVASIPATLKQAMKSQGVTFVEDEEGLLMLERLMAEKASGIRVVGRRLPAFFSRRSLGLELSLAKWPYLADHRLLGKVVLPLAAVVDLFAWIGEAHLALGAHLQVENLELFKGIEVSEATSIDVHLLATQGDRAKVELWAQDGAGARYLAYRAQVSAADGMTKAAELKGEGEPVTLALEDFYRNHTFHGPMLRGITAIERHTPNGVVGRIRSSAIRTFLPGTTRARWAIDPLLLDASFQLAAYWTWTHRQKVGYPIGFARLVVSRPFAPKELRAVVSLVEESGDRFVGNIDYFDLEGAHVARLESVEGRFLERSLTAPSPTDTRPEARPVTPAEVTPKREPKKAENGGGGNTLVAATPPEHSDIARFPEIEQLEQRLEMAKLIGLENPYFAVHSGTAKNRSVVSGVEMLNFSSYNYLGFSGHPEVVAAAKEAIDRYGTSVSASRIASGERPIHQALEKGLAAHLGVEDAIVFVSGHATNVTTIGTLLSSEDLILHDSLIHDSIMAGIRLSGATRRPYAHENMEALERLLSQLRGGYRRVLICAEGIYSMDGDICDLPRLIALKKKYQALLLIDEAHSAGVLGPSGRGVGRHFSGLEPKDVDLWMGTLSKSYASCGGYIAGSEKLVRYLKYSAGGFVYSAGITPANCAAALCALELMKKHPEVVERLRKNSKFFLEQAKAKGINTGHAVGAAVVPAIIGNSLECMQLSAALAKRRINVQPIVYPAVEDDSARLRFFISATHTEDELRHTVEVLAEELARIRSASGSERPAISV